MRFASTEQPISNSLLPKSFLGMLNISECHLKLLLKFNGVLYTSTPILGYTLKTAIAEPQMLPLKLHYRDNKLDLFFRLVSKWFCRIQGFITDTEIVNRMSIIFTFPLYNMSFFTLP